jgi:hypothetical protein
MCSLTYALFDEVVGEKAKCSLINLFALVLMAQIKSKKKTINPKNTK